MIDKTNLRTLRIVAETGRFASAAERLHRTRWEVRHSILELEEALGCRLIDRLGRRIVTTQAGEVMLGRAGARRRMKSVHENDGDPGA